MTIRNHSQMIITRLLRESATVLLIACSQLVLCGIFMNSENNIPHRLLSYLDILSDNTRNSVETKKDCRFATFTTSSLQLLD